MRTAGISGVVPWYDEAEGAVRAPFAHKTVRARTLKAGDALTVPKHETRIRSELLVRFAGHSAGPLRRERL